MVKKIINIGVEGNDATGDPIRDAFEKTNENFNELYSFFGKGDGISFTDLTDYDTSRDGKLVSESIFIVNNSGNPNIPGNKILAKNLVGDGILIDNSDPKVITLKNLGAKLVNDPEPALGGRLDAQQNIIYNLRDGTTADANGTGIPLTKFAATQGYVGSNFVKKAGDTMTGALNVPANATGTQVPRRQEVVGKAGDTMTGALILNADPTNISNPLTAATKNYVDTTSFSSQVNLFVSASSGDDFRFDVAEEKRGSALAYSFKTINRACFKAEQLMNAAGLELGPYQKPIFFNNGASISRAISIVSNNDGKYTLTITNGGGSIGTDMRGTGVNPATVDVRAGLIIRGTTSGALAMITYVDPTVYSSGTIDITDGDDIPYSGAEKYTVMYKNFKDALKTQPIEFIPGETLEYSDSIQKLNITIFIESGEYYENLPIRVPPNVTLVGDDTRRVIIKPKTGISGSIYNNIYFRRDITIDNLIVLDAVKAGSFVAGQYYTIKDPGNTVWTSIGAANNDSGTTFKANAAGIGTGTAYSVFGYHYLTDPSKSFYNNPSNLIDTINSPNNLVKFVNAQKILNANRTSLKTEMSSWITTNYPTYSTTYSDVGPIIDALGFDMIYGGYTKTLEYAMSFYGSPDSLKVITSPELTKTLAILSHLKDRLLSILSSSTSIVPEAGYDIVVGSLVEFYKNIIEKNITYVNFPKNNDKMDVFLLNDSNRVRTLSCQGHGGFMGVLDPAGQILTKSPYVFQCSSFTKSINAQQFAGGLFVDAFTGNINCTILQRISSTKIKVGGILYRVPTNIPVSFMVNGIRFEVDYIDHPNTYQTGQYDLYLNANTSDDTTYTGTSNLLLQNNTIELETAGNRSMLCSDFTQVNDIGYGIFATNGSFVEAVSVFTYYCYRGFYSLNGSQIRSLNGSCAYGTYALSSEGSDPTEVATTADLRYPMIQILTSYSDNDLSDKNAARDLFLYVKVDKDRSINYIPFASSEIEIDHGVGDYGKYFVSNSSFYSSGDNYDVYSLALSTSGNNNTLTTGLKSNVSTGTPVIVRVLRNFDVLHLPIINPTRPSTALQFKDESDIYHLTSYNAVTKTLIATSMASDGSINVNPGSTVGLKAGEPITFTGVATFNIAITLGAIYYISSFTNSTIKVSQNYTSAIAGTVITPASANTNTTISPTAISGNKITLTQTIPGGAQKGQAWLFPSTVTGVTGLIPGYTYYLTDDVTGTQISLAATYENAMLPSPTVLTISGTPGGTLTGAYLGKYTTGTIGGGTTKDLSATLTIDSNYNYVIVTPKTGAVGDTSITIEKIGISDRSRIVGMIFAWGTRIHKITTWTNTDSTTDTITFTNLNGGTGLSKATQPQSYSNKAPTLKAGLNNVTSAGAFIGLSLISEISVMRASGHDLVDIGTGGFANSNIPTNIYGLPAVSKTQANEVQEIGRGRVFYSTTDQDGNFRIGKYFQVDQGTGSVTFAASLAISNIDGLGFSRGGVTVKEFATDDTMFNVSPDTVPTQSAVVGYINKRLGITQTGSITTNPIGPGFIPRDGSVTFGTKSADTLDMNTHRIVNLANPSNDADATNKSYVDSFFKRSDGIRKEISGFVMSDKTTFTIDSVARANNIVTIVLKDTTSRSGYHGLSVGSPFVISGLNQIIGFNGNFTVKEVVSDTTIKCDNIGDNINTYTVNSGIITTESNISMNGAKITNLSTPTDNYDAATLKYVNDKTNISTLNDVTLTNIAANHILYYNAVTSKWNNGLLSNSQISDSASIAQSKLNLSKSTAGENIGATTLGISSYSSTNFSVTNGFVTLASNGVALANLAQIGHGFVLGNNSGATAIPSTISFANALESAITTPSQGLIARGSNASFSTIGYDAEKTNSTIVQRTTTGGINATSVSAEGNITGGNLNSTGDITAEGKITAKSSISFKTELQLNTKKTIDANGVATRLWNQDGTQALEINGSSGSNVATIYGKWTLANNATLNATYADLAEYYTSDNDYSAGTVVMIGGEQDVTLAKGYGNTAVAGIVSENPAYLMNVDCAGIRVAIALQGRVPCKVIGKIKKGDLLIVSQVPGAATSSNDPKPGSIIGKALSNYDSDRIGTIEVLVGKH